MTKTQRNLLAQSYQSAWYAFSGQPIAVSIDEKGLFKVRYDSDTFLPEWNSRLSAVELLTSLSSITELLAVKRETQEAV